MLTGGCGLERAVVLAAEAFFKELDRYTLADLVDTSPALASLALWQPVTWSMKTGPARARRAR